MTLLMPSQQQIPLALPVDAALQEELMLKKARELYRRSRFLSSRYPSFKRLMDDPIAGRCMRLSATHLLRLGDRTPCR
ncbi:MAG: hypothetical protein ACOYNZ_12050 [Rhodoferax sp.]